METTLQTIGVAITPHDFRRCGSVTSSLRAPDMPHLSSALLEHTDRRTTEKHYNRASSMSAALSFGELVDTIKRS